MKFAVIGLGSIGARHAKNLKAMGQEVIGYDTDEDKMIRANGCVVGPIDAINRADAVVIASPSEFHVEQLSLAVAAKKHVLIEKPIGLEDVGQIKAILTEADAHRLVVMTGYNLRFHHCVAQAEVWLAQGMIGKPFWANIVCGQYAKKSHYLADGVVLNWSHEIDLALHLFGPGTVSCATIRRNGVEDVADIVIVHESGTRSSVHLDYVMDPEMRQTVIVGEKGRIFLDLARRSAAMETKSIIMRPVYQEYHDSFDENYIAEMDAFIDRIKGKKTPGATGWDGLAAMVIGLQAREMAK